MKKLCKASLIALLVSMVIMVVVEEFFPSWPLLVRKAASVSLLVSLFAFLPSAYVLMKRNRISDPKNEHLYE